MTADPCESIEVWAYHTGQDEPAEAAWCCSCGAGDSQLADLADATQDALTHLVDR